MSDLRWGPASHLVLAAGGGSVFNAATRGREQGELDDLMRALGFAMIVRPDTTTRPIQPAWYQGMLHGRLCAVTMVNRRIVGLNSGVGGGNRNVNVTVVSVVMAAVGVPEVDYGIHTQFDVLPDPDPAVLSAPGQPGHGMPVSVRNAFHRFARGPAAPFETGRSKHARYVRITNRSKLADYFPPVVLPTTEVIVMHEIPMDENWQAGFVPATNALGWVAHALEAEAAQSLEG